MKLLLFVFFFSFYGIGVSTAKTFTYDSSSLQGGDHTFTISTNSKTEFDLTVRLSNRTDDTQCHGGSINHQKLSANKKITEEFDFSRQGSPAVALYEWHLCFEIDNKTYKGWRGFDSGNNTQLVVDCNIDIEDLKQPSDLYLCETQTVSFNKDNHNEYAQFCVRESCKSFETKEQYEFFRHRDAKNVVAHYAVGKEKILSADIEKRMPTKNEIEKLTKDAIAEISKYCRKLTAEERNSCYEYRDRGKENLSARENWQPQINENSLKEAFPELKNLKLIPSILESFIPKRKFFFAPHKISSNVVDRYVVYCSSIPKDKGSLVYGCSLNLFQSFYLDDPNEYFEIDPMSNVTIALTAFKKLRDFPVDTIEDKDARDWLNLHKVKRINVENDLVTFSFYDSACNSQIVFRIATAPQEFEFVALKSEMCF